MTAAKTMRRTAQIGAISANANANATRNDLGSAKKIHSLDPSG